MRLMFLIVLFILVTAEKAGAECRWGEENDPPNFSENRYYLLRTALIESDYFPVSSGSVCSHFPELKCDTLLCTSKWKHKHWDSVIEIIAPGSQSD
jgi:hypothetical protein